MAFCDNCGHVLKPTAKFCGECGTALDTPQTDNSQNQTNYTPPPQTDYAPPPKQKRSMGKAKKFGIVFVIFIVVIGVLGALSATGSSVSSVSSGPTSTTPQPVFMTEQEVKDNAILLHTIGYENLFRYNEDHVGKIVFFSGEVIQVRHDYSDSYTLRVDVNPDQWETSALYVNYVGPRILEDDNVTIYGEVVGIKYYKSLLGQQISIPEINTLIINGVLQP